MTLLTHDLRLALRGFHRSPTFVVGASAILALGIGMSTAMFTVYKTVFVDQFPVAAEDRLAIIHPLDRRGTHLDVPYTYLADVARDTALFRAAAGVQHRGAQVVPFMDGNASIELGAVSVSGNFFDVFGMRPALGHFFHTQDGRAGAPPVIVLSYDAWRRRFGGDSSIIGHVLVLPYTQQRANVVGVAPRGFGYPTGAEAWIPIPPEYQTTQVDVIARLAPNVTIEAARAGFHALTKRLNPFAIVAPNNKQQFDIAGVAIQSFADTMLAGSRPAVVALTIAVGLLLLIACVNVGNLVLVRLLARAREIAVRRAIGAGSADIVRLLVVENGALAILGGALGLVISLGLLRVVSVAAAAQLPRSDALAGVGVPFYMAFGLTLVALLLFGVVPSLVASTEGSYMTLRSDSRTGMESRARRRARQWLVSSQIALALVMLTGAALLARTLARLQTMDLGYEPDHLSIVSFTGPKSTFANDTVTFETGRMLLARIQAVPAVQAATPIEMAPFNGQSFFIMQVAPSEQPAADRIRNPFLPFEFVGAEYFRTLEIPILRGRSFTASDVKGAPAVVIVNETLARRFWPNENAVGKQLIQTMDKSAWTVIGVAKDTHFRELKNVGPIVYFDWEQIGPWWNGSIAVRTKGSLAAVLPSLRAATREVNPDLVLWDSQTMDQLLAEPLAQPRLSTSLLTAFSIVALLLSAIGLYGVIATLVRQHTRDIGVRIALGATPHHVRRLILGEAIRVAAAGLAVGAAGALIGGRLLASQLYEVSPTDPVSLTVAAATLFVVAIVAAYVPAHRAARIDPVEALRAE